ncbi:hypothetical protein QBC33DRAFT_351503 [Phialemonium atrogriseum]|uniref:Uncharacterized protein n=1 Tax=Phialemonium atrogriseum TaxID=1093897 RepID=A0AAJ0C7W6_9PEZI|nr:uncharacterized protein QBC33DRAFT_351503 [Phialemonium atrogriseum]KAK1769326.1 hypothetical protein QBC33DRAFT_351503 [Phialemonium atrogriseum]
MDDAKRLVTELLGKLAELDSKVATYQQDMNAEFERYSALLLKDVSEDVSNEVSRVIAESMSNYLMLQAPNRDCLEFPATLTEHGLWGGRRSPPPILYHTSGTPKDGPRSPHEREKEFQGVFTPSFLPLLDSSDRPPHSPPSSSPLPSPSPAFTPSLDSILSVDEGLDARTSAIAAWPSPARRQTDGTVSSVDSSGSDSRVRRSALRRSSSSTKGSPRRVRFEFQGIEVLPTSSPQAPTSPRGSLEEAEATSAIVDDSPPYAGPSLLDVEGEEDWLPRPKKVSSTQALRALSRKALDEGTVWTVVNPDPEEAPTTMDGSNEAAPLPKPSPTTTKTAVTPAAVPAKNQSRSQRVAFTEKENTPESPEEKMENNEDDKDGSDDDFLSMRSKTSKESTSPAGRLPLAGSPVSAGVSSPFANAPVKVHVILGKASSNSNILDTKAEMREDEFFDFDEGEDTISGTKQRSENPDKYLSEDLDDDQDDKLHTHPTAPTRPLHSVQPTVSIPKTSPDTQPITPTSARFMQGSIGSYKGHSLMMSAIVNPRIQEEAAAMGDFSSFVGSVDGRSGFDAADLGSFRASLTKTMSVMPRSFSERMALEETLDKADDDAR